MGLSQSSEVDSSFLDFCEITASSYRQSQKIWRINPSSGTSTPCASFDTLLEDYHLALAPTTTHSPVHIRPRVDAILHLMLARAKHKVLGNYDLDSDVAEKLETLFWGYEQVITLPETLKAEGNIRDCAADYILWYGDQRGLKTNLVVVQAEKPIDSSGEYLPILAAMAMIQHNQKDSMNKETYGIFTDGFKWVFLHLNKKNQYCSLQLNWNEGQQQAILGQIGKILDNAVSKKLLCGEPEWGLLKTRSLFSVQQWDYAEEEDAMVVEADSFSHEIGPFDTTKMEAFHKLERKVKDLAKKFKLDPKLNAELSKAIDLARTESQQEIQKGKQKALPTMAITDIPPHRVEDTFRLKPEKNGNQVWHLNASERRNVPDYLRATLADYDLAFGDADQNEAVIRARVDAILLTTLAAKKKEEFGQHGPGKGSNKRTSMQSVSSYKSIHFGLETALSFQWPYIGKLTLIRGKMDYVVWYGSQTEAEANMVVVEAKKPGLVQQGQYQALAYMAIIHHARRKAGRANTPIYGVSTDSYDWIFIRLSPQGTVSYHLLKWTHGRQVEIISHLHKILEYAAWLSPAPTNTLGRQKTVEEASGLSLSDQGH